MKISLDRASGYTIHAYGPGKITLNIPLAVQIEAAGGEPLPDNGGKKILTHSLVVTPGLLISDWPPANLQQLAVEHIATVARLEPELVLLGLGERLQFPEPELMKPLIDAGIGIEYMDSPAACRTYNFLAAEGRNVAAAILIA